MPDIDEGLFEKGPTKEVNLVDVDLDLFPSALPHFSLFFLHYLVKELVG